MIGKLLNTDNSSNKGLNNITNNSTNKEVSDRQLSYMITLALRSKVGISYEALATKEGASAFIEKYKQDYNSTQSNNQTTSSFKSQENPSTTNQVIENKSSSGNETVLLMDAYSGDDGGGVPMSPSGDDDKIPF